LQGCFCALNVLPCLLWLGSPVEIRHNTLLRYEVPAFISTAVTTALQVSDVKLAAEFFEQGLSTTHQQSLQLKLKHISLEAKLPMHSTKLKHISCLLQSSFNKFNPKINYHVLAHERQQLIFQIRNCPGFEEFLLPQKYLKLSQAACHGTVVMLNYTETQTDAIIILSPFVEPIHIILSGITPSVVEAHKKNLHHALYTFSIHSREVRHGRPCTVDGSESHSLLDSVITWLWETIVRPVFDVLIKVCLIKFS
jgi:hypothetical protein